MVSTSALASGEGTGGLETGGVLFYNPANAVYKGIEDHPVQLEDGTWEGEPYVEGGAARPRVGLIDELWLLGDLNGDGKPEAVVGLWHSTGGSGTRNYAAVLERRAAGSVNTATVLLGDRVRIDGGAIENGMIRLDLVEHGPDEPACCPTHAVSRYYDGELKLIETKQRNRE
jgi:hypothetical protein